VNRLTPTMNAFLGGWLAALVATCSARDASGAEPHHAVRQLSGSWSGTVVVENRPVAVNLTISEGARGAGGAEFHYGVPRSCGLNAEYSGEGDDKQYFSFTTSTGGFCDGLIGGYVAARLASEGTLAFDAASSDAQTSTSGTLRRSGEDGLSDEITGNWRGQVMAGGRPIALNVSVRKGSIGDELIELHFGAPRSCRLSAEYEGVWQGQAAFGMKSATGGFCDSLTTGLMVMSAASGGTLSFNITTPDGAPSATGTLHKAR